MTEEQRLMVNTLVNCRFLPGSYDKRFVNDMSLKPDDYELSEKQAAFLGKLFYKYRRQYGGSVEIKS